ncbi:MAG: cysteine desulfurase NifS, partial [Thermoanaerobaculia bacterium]|nr:cysteine desulfurase NifS [Thermoanaerobaculia bacterium]
MTVPLGQVPGIPRLALGHATGEPDVSAFLGERATAAAIAARAAAALAAFRPREGADPALAPLARGHRA